MKKWLKIYRSLEDDLKKLGLQEVKEIKNVAKLRFSGFSDEWKEKKLVDFLEFYSTNSLARDCLNYE